MSGYPLNTTRLKRSTCIIASAIMLALTLGIAPLRAACGW